MIDGKKRERQGEPGQPGVWTVETLGDTGELGRAVACCSAVEKLGAAWSLVLAKL